MIERTLGHRAGLEDFLQTKRGEALLQDQPIAGIEDVLAGGLSFGREIHGVNSTPNRPVVY
ncbi:hypothetical protein D3C81_1345380 [compost metagenome]